MRRVAVLLALLATACSSGSSGPGTAGPAPGASATAGSSPTTSSSASRGAATLLSWPTYHGRADRAGAAPGPVPPLHEAWSLDVDAALYAQPIVAAGSIVAATENNTVYAVDPTGGHVRWRTHLVAPARLASLPCGNIDPSGITGTPAYDDNTHTLFVATEDSDARHALVALDPVSGAVRWQRSLDVAPGRDRHAQQERGALLVSHGRVYVAFGGRDGDCGNYVGYVAGVPTDGRGATVHYEIPTTREGGIWAPPGPVADAAGDVYVASGNGAEVGGQYDGSDSVVRLSPTLKRLALFAPSTWQQDNQQDLDLGSMAPALVGNRIVIAGKRGQVYLLSQMLGGVGGELAHLDGCAGYGGAAVTGDVVLLPCNGGIRALRVAGSALRWLWQRSGTSGSPVVAGSVVYAFDGSSLVALRLSDGHRVASVHVGDVTRFTTPVPAGRLVVVGTKSSLVALAAPRSIIAP